MDAQTLITKLREDRLDDALEPYLWSDETLIRHLNDAVQQACLRARLLVDSQTPKVCQIPLIANTAVYALHKSALAIKSAHIDTDALILTTVKRHNRMFPGWQTSTANGTPTHLIVDYQTGKVYADPIPNAAATLTMTVWRLPLETELLEELGDEPVIPEHTHEGLLDWAENRCYTLTDAETRDRGRAESAAAAFTANFGPLPSHNAIRLWGISPMRGTYPEFL